MTLSSLLIYAVFVDPQQGNKYGMPFSLPTTRLYVEFIGREKASAYLHCIYCKVKQRIKESWVIQSNQDVHVCGYMYGGNLILLCSLKTYLSFDLEIFLQDNKSYLIHLFFLGGHLSTHCFQYLGHLSIFSILFLFMNNFCKAHVSFLQQNFEI